MDFQPFLTQLIPHPNHRYLLPNALTLAALGEPDHKIRKYRPDLREGEHFVYFNDDSNRRRLFYTLAGLLQLSTLLNTERATRLRDSLIAWLGQSNSAIVHQPSDSRRLYSQHEFENDYSIAPLSPQPSYLPQQYNQPTFDIDQSSHSGSLLNSPVLRELLQLRRDELELQRSQQETERLRLFQRANPQQPNQPDDNAESRKEPPQIHVHIENNVDSGYGWDRSGFVEALSTLFLILITITSVGVLFGSGLAWLSRQSGGYEHVR